MLKQSSSRNLRSKGFKVKHVIQVCLLLAAGVWLVNQLKHSYDKKAIYDKSTGMITKQIRSEHEVVKLGRKDMHPRVAETDFEIKNQGNRVELEDEVEEIKPEEIEDGGRGGGDDEIDGHDQEKAEDEEPEEVEDLIDVDDREREDRNEDQENEDKVDQLEDVSSLDDHAQSEGDRILQEAREEHYKGDDASSAVMHNSQAIITQLGIGGLRKIKEKEVNYVAEKDQLEQEYRNHGKEKQKVERKLKHQLVNSVAS